jgi:hypothetical protein
MIRHFSCVQETNIKAISKCKNFVRYATIIEGNIYIKEDTGLGSMLVGANCDI